MSLQCRKSYMSRIIIASFSDVIATDSTATVTDPGCPRSVWDKPWGRENHLLFGQFCPNCIKQECIPVGCVPSTAVSAIRPLVVDPLGETSPWKYLRLDRKWHHTPPPRRNIETRQEVISYPQKEHGTRQEMISYLQERTWDQTGSDIILTTPPPTEGQNDRRF